MDGQRGEFNDQCKLNYIMGTCHTKESFKKTHYRLDLEKAFSIISFALHRYHCRRVSSSNVRVLL